MRINRGGVISGCLALALVGASSAATIEVPQEYATITEALGVAQPGDTVLVDDGFYFESVHIGPGVTVASRNHRAAQISEPTQGAPVVRFTGTGQPEDEPALIRGCVVFNFYEFGPPPLWSDNPNAVVEDCWVGGGGPGGWQNPVVYMPSGGTVRNCRVSSLRWTNFFLSTEPGAYMLIEGCLIENPFMPYSLNSFGDGSVTVFRNNTFVQPEGYLDRNGPDITMLFENNILWQHSLCFGSNPPAGLEFRYNCLDWFNPFEHGICPGAEGPGNFTGDPLFCEEPGKTWWLTPESPCIGAGENGEDIGAPFGICGVTGIGNPEADAAGSDYRVWPNPASSEVRVSFLPSAILYLQIDGAPLMARVLDASGRLVAVADGRTEGTEVEFSWDTRLQNGDLAPAGIYYLQPVVEPGTRTSSARITVVR